LIQVPSLDERREQTLREHLDIGKRKPVSYLPLKTIETFLGLTIEEYRLMITERGGETVVVSGDASVIDSGALYAFSRNDLSKLLASQYELLIREGWPTTPDQFIARIASEWLDGAHPILPVVREAFGDDL
jgi:hypothetical protein